MEQTTQHNNENKTHSVHNQGNSIPASEAFRVLREHKEKESQGITAEGVVETEKNIPLDLNFLRKTNIGNNLAKITEYAITKQTLLYSIKVFENVKAGGVVIPEKKETNYMIEITELPVAQFHSFCGLVDDFVCPERYDIALKKVLDKSYHFILDKIDLKMKKELTDKIKELNNINNLLKDRDPYPLDPEKEKNERVFPNESVLSIMRLASLLGERYGNLGNDVLERMTYRQILWYVDLLLYDNYDMFFEDKNKRKGQKSSGVKNEPSSSFKTELTGNDVERKFFANLPGDAVLKEDTGGCLVYNRTYKVP